MALGHGWGRVDISAGAKVWGVTVCEFDLEAYEAFCKNSRPTELIISLAYGAKLHPRDMLADYPNGRM